MGRAGIKGGKQIQNSNKSRVGSRRGQRRSPMTVEKHSMKEGRMDNKE
jgi:hypothetical protein